jgi:hypothetical protein
VGRPVVVGSQAEREQREVLVETVLQVGADGRPQTMRREVRVAILRQVERDAAGRIVSEGHQPLPWHGKLLSLQRMANGSLRAADTAGEMSSTERLVFDLVSLQDILPPEPVLPGAKWSPPVSALLQLRGSTEPKRTLSGRFDCRFQRALQQPDGRRMAEIQLDVVADITEQRELAGQIRYELYQQLHLSGRWLHDIDRKRPWRVSLDGSLVVEHRPREVGLLAPGNEALAQPFRAEGSITIELEFADGLRP